MRRIIVGLAVSFAVFAALAGCASMGRGHGPVEAFTFQSGVNKVLARDVVGAIDERVEPKEIRVVVPAGTDLHALVATLSLSKEAVLAVVSSGSRVVQQNGVTPNDFSVPMTYSITVAGDKQPWTYRVFVREAEGNARLSMLAVPQGAILQPAFSPTVRRYTLDVPFATVKVRLEARGQTATLKSVTIDGAEIVGPAGAAVVDFASVQERSVAIDTLAEDGLTREQYVVTIRRGAPDSNASLAALELKDVPLMPAFAPGQLSYQAVVPFETTRLVLRARPQSPVAVISLGSAVIVRGGRAGTPALQFTGDPTAAAGAQVDFSSEDRLALVIIVTAEDQSVQQYLVDVQRAPPDRNNRLSDLSLTAATGDIALLPQFTPGRFGYTAEVPYSARQVNVLAMTQSRFAAVSIEAPPAPGGSRGTVVFAGNPQGKPGATVDFPPPVARLLFVLSVTAQDGSVQRYALDLRRGQPDRNADLASLVASGGSLSPAFSARAVSYDLVLSASVDSVKITASAASPAATITVAEQPGVKPAPSQSLTVAVAQGSATVLTFVVSAEEGSQRLYRVRISRETAPAALDGNALLQLLVVSGAQIAPSFDPSVILYNARIAADAESAAVTALPQSQLSSIMIDGQAAGKNARTITVPAGATRIVLIDVTAQNGAVVRYTLRLTRDMPAGKPSESVTQPGGTEAGGRQPAGGSAATSPADAGSDRILVSAKNLRLQRTEADGLTNAGDQIGNQARVTVRYYRSGEMITQYTVPVDVKQQGGVPAVTFSYRSNGVTLSRNRLVEVEAAIPTSKGRFLFYTESEAADSEISIDVPFLLYGDNPQVHWPAVGSMVQVGGYLSKLPPTKDRDVDKEAFDTNAKGEYSLGIEIFDARTGTSFGKDTVATKPGQGRSRMLTFGKGMLVPEGVTVKYVLTAKSKNGRLWTATDTTQVWTTKISYPTGFMPVLLLVSDDLAPETSGKGG